MKKPISEQESDLFKQAMKGVMPLNSPKKIVVESQKSKPNLKQPDNLVIQPLASINTETVTAETRLLYNSTGLQHRLLRKLRRGQITYQAILDLHGHTLTEAEYLLSRFLEENSTKHIYCVQIIHGKGLSNQTQPPLLKNQVNRWLRCHPAVLAFCSAQPKDGGTGALYVLLKQHQ